MGTKVTTLLMFWLATLSLSEVVFAAVMFGFTSGVSVTILVQRGIYGKRS